MLVIELIKYYRYQKVLTINSLFVKLYIQICKSLNKIVYKKNKPSALKYVLFSEFDNILRNMNNNIMYF